MWKERAVELKFEQNISWTQLPAMLEKEFGQPFTFNQVRNALRRHPKYGDKPEETTEIGFVKESIIAELTARERPKQHFIDKFKLSDRMLTAILEDIREQGYLITDADNQISLCKVVVDEVNEHKRAWNGEKIIRFGLCGDNQCNSKYTQITHLHNFYDICEAEGVADIYHCGDLDEGEQMRPGHQYECYTQGADEHIDNIVNTYPKREGITTHFITGNHDHSIIKRAGYDIGYTIATKRKDMKYLGQSSAFIYLTPNCTLELRHPLDGTAYAISYKMQKMIEAMQGGEKPNILAVGHYHKTEYLFYRNVHAIQTASFQAQTSWMRGKGISASVGGWIIELAVDEEGTIKRFKQEFIPYYQMIKDDWKNWI